MRHTPEPYLSVVVTTRNDDHGGDPLKRLQALVNTFDAQCRRTGLDAELIVVEWNSPSDRPSVGSLLRLPEPASCTYRFIEVPPALHQRLKYADVLPLFQMIAKNVGIRRARGQFVLATNIDIIFSNELVAQLAARALDSGTLYRVDRHDIEPNVPLNASLDEQIEYCRTHQLRVHTRWGSYPVDGAGRIVALPEDIVDGRTVSLGEGWHVKEAGGATGQRCYRWASERVELVLRPRALGASGPLVLDVEIQPNPYDPLAWFETVAVVDGRELARTRVTGGARLVVPIEHDGSDAERRVELHLAASADVRRHLPAFEQRDSLRYRVMSARLRPRAAVDDGRRFPYPAAFWAANEYEGSTGRVTSTAEGVAAETDATAQSYCLEYGPLHAAADGLHRFNVSCTVVEGGVSFNVLAGDRAAWIPAAVNQVEDGDRRRFEIAIELTRGQAFWLMAWNNHPQGDGVSKFTVHRLEGSEDPAITLPGAGSATGRSAARGWRSWVGDRADGVGRAIAKVLGRRLRYRVARTAPEFGAVEKALRASDQQLRELAPLRYLGDFNALLRDRRPDNLHVNGCGDFQLMAREHWVELRGYPEFETFSMNIDGLFSYVAAATGVKEEILRHDIYHLEHEVGSGWSPEGEALLRKRIAERGITWLDAGTVYVWATYMKWLGRPMIFNSSDWGFGSASLVERTVAPACDLAS